MMADSAEAEPQWTVSWVTEDDEDEEEEEVAVSGASGVEGEVIFGVASDCVQLPQDQVVVTSAGLTALAGLKPSPVFLDDAHHEVVVGGDVSLFNVCPSLFFLLSLFICWINLVAPVPDSAN